MFQPPGLQPSPWPQVQSQPVLPGPLPLPEQAVRHGVPQGQYLVFLQELISEHFGEDGASYETEIQELEDLRQVGGLLPLLLLQRQTEEEGRKEGWIQL